MLQHHPSQPREVASVYSPLRVIGGTATAAEHGPGSPSGIILLSALQTGSTVLENSIQQKWTSIALHQNGQYITIPVKKIFTPRNLKMKPRFIVTFAKTGGLCTFMRNFTFSYWLGLVLETRTFLWGCFPNPRPVAWDPYADLYCAHWYLLGSDHFRVCPLAEPVSTGAPS